MHRPGFCPAGLLRLRTRGFQPTSTLSPPTSVSAIVTVAGRGQCRSRTSSKRPTSRISLVRATTARTSSRQRTASPAQPASSLDLCSRLVAGTDEVARGSHSTTCQQPLAAGFAARPHCLGCRPSPAAHQVATPAELGVVVPAPSRPVRPLCLSTRTRSSAGSCREAAPGCLSGACGVDPSIRQVGQQLHPDGRSSRSCVPLEALLIGVPLRWSGRRQFVRPGLRSGRRDGG